MNSDLKPGEQQNESFRDRIATVDAKGKRNWVFAHKPKGRFYNIRTLVSLGFFIIFFALPFIKVNDRPLAFSMSRKRSSSSGVKCSGHRISSSLG